MESRDRRGRRVTEVMLCNIQSTLFVLCCVLLVYLNKVTQECLYVWGRHEKYLPIMEKLTGAGSLRGSRVILFLFPFSAGIFCWAELKLQSEAQLKAEPDHLNMPWFGNQTNRNGSGSVFWFQCIFFVGNHVFQFIRDLVKWSCHQKEVCRALPRSTYSLKETHKPKKDYHSTV